MRNLLIAAAAALSLVATPALADNQSRLVRVVNNSNSQPIVAILAENVHGNTHTVTTRRIPAGYNTVVDFEDAEGHNHCVYKIGAAFANGTVAMRTVNVCQISQWNIDDTYNTVE